MNVKFSLLFLLFSFPAFAQNWQKLAGGLPYYIYSMTSDSNYLYVGTYGKEYGGIPNNGLRIWDGSIWHNNTIIPGYFYSINAIKKYKNKLFISAGWGLLGGEFYIWDGANLDTIPTDLTIRNFYIYYDTLFVVGSFKSIAGIKSHFIARFYGQTWTPVFDTILGLFEPSWGYGDIWCAVYYKGELYVGGNFQGISDDMHNIARWDGVQWKPVGNGIKGGMADVWNFMIYHDTLYVCGYFYKSNGNPGNHIAAWDGNNWHEVGGGVTSPYGWIRGINIYNDELYVYDGFKSIGGITANGIAKWNSKQWCDFAGRLDVNGNEGGAEAIEVFRDTLYMGGAFFTIDGDTFNHIARWTGGNYVDTCGAIIGQSEISAPKSEILISPNPFSSYFTIEFKIPEISSPIYRGQGGGSFILYDFTGKQISISPTHPFAPSHLLSGFQTITFSTSHLTPGIYFLITNINNQIFTRKIIKL